jgi:hypothetical protein
MMRIALFCMVIASFTLLAHNPAFAHAGNLDQAPWHACEGLSLSAACSFENAAHDTHRGTCRSIADSLLCVRNQPIEHASGGPVPALETARSSSGSVGFFALAILALLNVPLVLQRFTRRAST